MKLYNAWLDDRAWDPTQDYRRQDLNIFQLRIQHHEGEVASAYVMVQAMDDVFQKLGQTLVISVENKEGAVAPIFRGRMIALPQPTSDHFLLLEIQAIPEDLMMQLEALKKQLSASNEIDSLFIPLGNRHDISEYLEAHPALYCFDRVTHQLTLSHYFQGQVQVTMGENILTKTLKTTLLESPQSELHVHVQAQWIQKQHGTFDLLPKIKKVFKGGFLQSLQPQSFINQWPESGQVLGKSGYQVIRSALYKLPNHSAERAHWTQKITLKNKVQRLPLYGYDGQLVLGWQRQQRIKESVHFCMRQTSQLPTRPYAQKQKLTLTLENIESEFQQEDADFFFQTPRGERAIRYALRMAQCRLGVSARCIEVQFQVPFEDAAFLSLDTTVHVKHPSLPMKCMIGKLKSIVLQAHHNTAYALIKVGVSAGIEQEEDTMRDTLSENLLLEEYDQQTVPIISNTQDLIQSIEVKNSVEEQLERLSNLGEETPVLESTTVEIRLQDLRTQDCFEKKFSISQPISWSAPQGIFLTCAP